MSGTSVTVRGDQSLSAIAAVRPNARVDGFRCHPLSPHRRLTTENVLRFLGRQSAAGGQGIGNVVLRRRLNEIDIVTIRENAVVTFERGYGECRGAAPRVNHDVPGEFRLQYLVPADHLLLVLLKDFQ